MNRLFFLIEKEFRQIFRNKAMLPIMFGMPIIQMLILGKAATMEVNHISFVYTDLSQSVHSRNLIQTLTSGNYFMSKGQLFSEQEAQKMLDAGDVKMWLRIPSHFSEDIGNRQPVKIQAVIDAVDGYTAGLLQNYAAQVLALWNAELVIISPDLLPVIAERHWYNPEMSYSWYMVPGILVILVTMISAFLSSMSIVREREIGTMEQLNVTPIPKWVFITGKLLPFWIIALFELAIGLLISRIVFSVPINGSLLLLFCVAGIYLVGMLGLGLLISTFTETQQQAMLIAWFIMVVFMLLGGLFTPIESMPDWAKTIASFNPVAWFIKVMRQIMLKGSGVSDVLSAGVKMVVFSSLMISLAVFRYKKTTS